jgi:glycine dehydrogenase subunit 2
MGIAKIRNYHQAHWDEPVIFELSTPGVRGILPPEVEPGIQAKAGDVFGQLPDGIRRDQPPALPEVSQKHVLSHYLHLSQEVLGSNLCPDVSQGTCTMKYNPRVNEDLVANPDFADLHPLQPDETVQGIMEIYWEVEQYCKELAGMDRFCLQPGGGAHAVFTAASIARAYHRDRGEGDRRDEIITTMFSHPCDAASPATAGFKVTTLMPLETGYPDLEAFKAALSDRVASIHITNPEDTGIYNPIIDQFTAEAHKHGVLCFYDQANLNGIMGITRARDCGFDMCHFNIHKTFGSPHGCSGPGTGALGLRAELAKYMPYPIIDRKEDGSFFLNYDRPHSVGKIKGFMGSAGVVLRAYAWLKMMGPDYLRECAEISVLNNNYLQKKLEAIPGEVTWYAKGHRRLEQVRYSWEQLAKDTGVGTEDIMRRLGDFGIEHYWTSHHPWVVPEPFTLEPCETFSKDDLDEYAAVFARMAKEAYDDPEFVKQAPYRCAAHKNKDPREFDDPGRWATTWKAYQKKHGRK